MCNNAANIMVWRIVAIQYWKIYVNSSSRLYDTHKTFYKN